MRLLIVLLLLLLFSCGNDSAGSVSEAGNAKISCIIQDSNAVAVSGLTVALVPSDFDPISGDRDELQFTLSDAQGAISFQTKAGSYNLWGQQKEELLFTQNITVAEDDTLTLQPQQIKQSGTVAIRDEKRVTSVSAKGFPFPFAVVEAQGTYYARTVPEGTFAIAIQNSDEIIEKQSTVFPNDTTTITKQYNWTHWFPKTELNSVYSIYSSGDTLLVGTGNALAVYAKSEWSFLTATSESVPSCWVLGITSFENKVYLATEKGAAQFTGDAITTVSGINELKMSRFMHHANKLWYSANEEIGALQNGTVSERFTQADLGTTKTLLSVLPEDDTLWVGTSGDGLYYKTEENWQRDTSFSPDWATTQLYFLDRFEEKLWMATIGNGIYCRENDQWHQYSVASGDLPTDNIYATCVDTVENQLLLGTLDGYLISYANGTFETIDDFRTSISEKGIFAIHRNKSRIYLGTYGQGMVVLE